MKKVAAIYTQKKDLNTFLYLSKFISELDKRGVRAVIYSATAEAMEFSHPRSGCKYRQAGLPCEFYEGGNL